LAREKRRSGRGDPSVLLALFRQAGGRNPLLFPGALGRASPASGALFFIGRGGLFRIGLLFLGFLAAEPFLEVADAFAQAFPELGQSAGAEDDDDEEKDEQELGWSDRSK